jgi:ABC-type lipoprotein export system ATPase subunit
MTVAPGEVVGLIGPSGSGKSTLLKCLGAIIEPTRRPHDAGRQDVIYDEGWKTPDLRALRRDSIGFVFQAPYLIPFLDVTDNVALLPMLAGHAQRRGPGSGRWTADRAGRGPPRQGRALAACRAASSSAWPLRGRWPTSRR